MQQQQLRNGADEVFYVVKVNGVPVSGKIADRAVAETVKIQLPAEQQSMAIVETVTQSGQTVLLG